MNGLLFYLVKNPQDEDVIVQERDISPIISFSQAKIASFQRKLIAVLILHCVIARFVISKHNLNRHCVVYAERVQV